MPVPTSERYQGKTGAMVRMMEIFKRLKPLAREVDITINTTEQVKNYLVQNKVGARYNVINSSLAFRNKIDLGFKSIYLLIKLLWLYAIPTGKDKEKKTVIYATADLFWEVIPAFIYKLRNGRVQWVQVIHHIYPDWRKRPGNKIINYCGSKLQRFSFFLIKRKADKIIIVNEALKKDLLKLNFKEQKICRSSNGIDFPYFNNLTGGNFTYDGVFLARLNYSKGIVDLIEIWQRICKAIPSAKLAVIGEADAVTQKFLTGKIKNYGLEKNIKLCGFLPDEAAYPLLKSGKVFVFPSHEEGWGIAIAEAMACGLPVVSWDLSNYQAVFENYTFRIKENNVDLFAAKIIEFLQKEAWRSKVGEKGKEFIRRYSWDNVARNEYEIIRR